MNSALIGAGVGAVGMSILGKGLTKVLKSGTNTPTVAGINTMFVVVAVIGAAVGYTAVKIYEEATAKSQEDQSSFAK